MEEVDAVDGLLGQPESLWEGGERHPADDHVAYGGRPGRSRPPPPPPGLPAVQERTGGGSPGGPAYACRRGSLPPARAAGVGPAFPRLPPPPPAPPALPLL